VIRDLRDTASELAAGLMKRLPGTEAEFSRAVERFVHDRALGSAEASRVLAKALDYIEAATGRATAYRAWIKAPVNGVRTEELARRLTQTIRAAEPLDDPHLLQAIRLAELRRTGMSAWSTLRKALEGRPTEADYQKFAKAMEKLHITDGMHGERAPEASWPASAVFEVEWYLGHLLTEALAGDTSGAHKWGGWGKRLLEEAFRRPPTQAEAMRRENNEVRSAFRSTHSSWAEIPGDIYWDLLGSPARLAGYKAVALAEDASGRLHPVAGTFVPGSDAKRINLALDEPFEGRDHIELTRDQVEDYRAPRIRIQLPEQINTKERFDARATELGLIRPGTKLHEALGYPDAADLVERRVLVRYPNREETDYDLLEGVVTQAEGATFWLDTGRSSDPVNVYIVRAQGLAYEDPSHIDAKARERELRPEGYVGFALETLRARYGDHFEELDGARAIVIAADKDKHQLFEQQGTIAVRREWKLGLADNEPLDDASVIRVFIRNPPKPREKS
jgi:hypothetical protein